MTRSQIPLSALMAVVALVGVGLTLLRNPTPAWASVLYTGMLALFGVATVKALARRGPETAFWAGMAAFGWVFYLTTFVVGPGLGVVPPLLVKSLTDWSVHQLNPPEGPKVRYAWSPVMATRMRGDLPGVVVVDVGTFTQVGGVLLVTAAAVAGAALVVGLWSGGFMKPPRLTVAAATLVILLAAVGFAALRDPSDLWTSAIYTLVTAGFTVATLAAIATRGAERAGWAGFAVFGWAYLFLTLYIYEWHHPTGRPQLLTELAFESFVRASPRGWSNVRQVGHCLIAPVVAAVGYFVGHAVAAGREAGGPA